MATEVSICSNALRRLGDDPITSLTDDTERARLCNSFYADARDAVLRYILGICNHKNIISTINRYTIIWFCISIFITNYPYCLRVLAMEYEDYIFKVENYSTQGRVLLTDESTAKILYVAKITDTTQFDALFVDVLNCKISSRLMLIQ